MSAIDLTGGDLLRALANVAARPAVDAAVRQRADAVAEEIEARANGAGIGPATVVRVLREGPGDYAVTVSAPGVFARAFGSADKPAEPQTAGGG
jgi:hypothetical protein